MRPEKATIVEDFKVRLNDSPFVLIADYTGLKVDQFTELRNRLAGAGAECKVVKNTFLRRAAKEAGLPDMGELKGQTAIIVGKKDVAAAAKVIKSFAAEFQKPVMKTGVIDRAVVSSAQIKEIADLPSREVLLATLLGVMNAPASKLVRVLNEPASSLARILNAKAAKGADAVEPAKAGTDVAEPAKASADVVEPERANADAAQPETEGAAAAG
jgi:large subunit ribosomal protein L10